MVAASHPISADAMLAGRWTAPERFAGRCVNVRAWPESVWRPTSAAVRMAMSWRRTMRSSVCRRVPTDVRTACAPLRECVCVNEDM